MPRLIAIPLGLLLMIVGCGSGSAERAEIDPELLETFKPAVVVSDRDSVTEAKVSLGRMLYYETRLSRDGNISCNSCHSLDRYGVDGKPVSIGHKDQEGSRNAPSVYHAAGHLLQFWDGRALDLEEQAKAPLTNPKEMAMADGVAVESVLRSITGYKALFQAAFPKDPKPLTFDNAARAIGAFERRLVTTSRWDKF